MAPTKSFSFLIISALFAVGAIANMAAAAAAATISTAFISNRLPPAGLPTNRNGMKRRLSSLPHIRIAFRKRQAGIISVAVCSATPTNREWQEQGESNPSAPAALIRIPVFPLRKSIRLITDRLTLHLYEERYLAMCDYMIQQSHRPNNSNQQHPLVFGALYVSDKPQLVKRGLGPVVPMLDVGDIGVVCLVHEWEEGQISIDNQSSWKRRITLNAIAATRFRIERIIHDGLGGGARSSEQFAKPSPFLFVEASLIRDKTESEENMKRIQHIQGQLEAILPRVEFSDRESLQGLK